MNEQAIAVYKRSMQGCIDSAELKLKNAIRAEIWQEAVTQEAYLNGLLFAFQLFISALNSSRKQQDTP